MYRSVSARLSGKKITTFCGRFSETGVKTLTSPDAFEKTGAFEKPVLKLPVTRIVSHSLLNLLSKIEIGKKKIKIPNSNAERIIIIISPILKPKL